MCKTVYETRSRYALSIVSYSAQRRGPRKSVQKRSTKIEILHPIKYPRAYPLSRPLGMIPYIGN